MTAEEKLIAAYRKADGRGKGSIIEHAESTAEAWPTLSRLRLIHLSPVAPEPGAAEQRK